MAYPNKGELGTKGSLSSVRMIAFKKYEDAKILIDAVYRYKLSILIIIKRKSLKIYSRI